MHPALIKLLKLRYRAAFRRMFRSVKTVRGMGALLFGFIMLLVTLGPGLLVGIYGRTEPDLDAVRVYTPLVLLSFALLSVNSSQKLRAIHFWPSEIDFLFPGPFTRRELLLYKAVSTVVGVSVLSLIFSMILLRVVKYWIIAYVGTVLALLFVQLLQMAFVFLAQILAERVFTVTRKLAVALAALMVAFVMWQQVSAGQKLTNVPALMDRMHETWPGFLLLLPFDVFGRTLAAENIFPEFLVWGGLAAALNVALFALIVKLDANYMEAAVNTSQYVYQRMQRMRSGGLRLSPISDEARWRFPDLPRLAGVGTIARRQFTKAMRSSLWLPLVLVAAGVAVMIFFVKERSDMAVSTVLIGAAAWCTFVFSSLFPFDFRGDIDQMDVLKQLPMRPTAIAAGQLIVPVVLVSLLQFVFLAVIAMQTGNWVVAALIAWFIPPCNVLLFAVENFAFLLYPVRMVASTPGDFQHFGRQMLLMSAKMILMGLAGTVAGSLALLVHLLHGSWPVVLAAAWFAATAECVAMLPVVAWGFQRFDVATETPA